MKDIEGLEATLQQYLAREELNLARAHLKAFEAERSHHNRHTAESMQAVRKWRMVLAPVWWSRLKHQAVTVRRCNTDDESFYQRCKADDSFVAQFGRAWGWHGDLHAALRCYGFQPPLLLGAVHWVIEYRGDRHGLASLTSLDVSNSRAEFSIGFPQKPPPGIAHKASLMVMHFAYQMVGLHKLYTYVYQDNVWAWRNTVRLGFLQEGVLVDHFRFTSGFVSAGAFGLTKLQAYASPKLIRTVSRLINQNWA
jgi:hypothetical protein